MTIRNMQKFYQEKFRCELLAHTIIPQPLFKSVFVDLPCTLQPFRKISRQSILYNPGFKFFYSSRHTRQMSLES